MMIQKGLRGGDKEQKGTPLHSVAYILNDTAQALVKPAMRNRPALQDPARNAAGCG